MRVGGRGGARDPTPKVLEHEREPATLLFARCLVDMGSLDGVSNRDALRLGTVRVLEAFGLDPTRYDAVPTNLFGQGYKVDEARTHSFERAVEDLARRARRAGCAFVLAAPCGYNGYASRASSGFILPFIVGGLASPDGTFSQGAQVVGRGLALVPRDGAPAFDEALVEWCLGAPSDASGPLPPEALRERLSP